MTRTTHVRQKWTHLYICIQWLEYTKSKKGKNTCNRRHEMTLRNNPHIECHYIPITLSLYSYTYTPMTISLHLSHYTYILISTSINLYRYEYTLHLYPYDYIPTPICLDLYAYDYVNRPSFVCLYVLAGLLNAVPNSICLTTAAYDVIWINAW
jgi:hypothetical protein